MKPNTYCEHEWADGYDAYGERDECPYSYEDMRRAWWSGWFHGMVDNAVSLYEKESARMGKTAIRREMRHRG